jgi:cytochrome c556
MRKRLTTMTGLTAALAALALGGSAIATATQSTAKRPAVEKTTGPDKDGIQSGDQTTPDTKAAGKAASVSPSESASESAPEASSESSAPSDGPGGHEDPAGVDAETQE